MKPSDAEFGGNLAKRHGRGKGWKAAFYLATLVAVLSLLTLLVSIVDDAFGYVLLVDSVPAADLARDGVPLESMDVPTLVAVLEENLSPFQIDDLNLRTPLAKRGPAELLAIIEKEILQPKAVKTWPFFQSLFDAAGIKAEADSIDATGRLQFRSWLSAAFVAGDQSVDPLQTGIRGAIIGSLLTILVTILFAFPIGIGAAVYLEEYAKDNRLNRLIQTNIYNLAGVPSIIYGMLGLALFVRALAPLTSGALFGVGDGDSMNGRTVLSAGLTLAILVLPIIIINAQEALKAVPKGLREASYAMGATKWQTIWHHVLPACMDRILTGTVLAVSRGIGETAPLVVVGASLFLTQDPGGLFSKFSTLPIQIFEWSSDPKPEFKNAAAAAILVLVVLLLALNATAIIARNKLRKKKVS